MAEEEIRRVVREELSLRNHSFSGSDVYARTQTLIRTAASNVSRNLTTNNPPLTTGGATSVCNVPAADEQQQPPPPPPSRYHQTAEQVWGIPNKKRRSLPGHPYRFQSEGKKFKPSNTKESTTI